MKKIDETRLETDNAARYEFLAEFIGFDEDDVSAIHQAAGIVGPLIPAVVERTYEKLLAYDATARHFVPRQHGFDGPVPTNLESLSVDHAQIQFRKEHLLRYLMHLIGHAYNAKTADYLDMVGKMHTPAAGNDQIDVPLVQMNALSGLLSDSLTDAIRNSNCDDETQARMLRAFNKLMWIQNGFIGRHYEANDQTGNDPTKT
jgi:hypothetical protein